MTSSFMSARWPLSGVLILAAISTMAHAQIPVVGPGDRSLNAALLVDRSSQLEFQGLSASGDSVTMRLRLARSEHDIPPDQNFLIAYQYAPPTKTTDSLVVTRNGLAPRRETLRLSGRVIALDYTATSVGITIRADTGGNDASRPAAGHPRVRVQRA